MLIVIIIIGNYDNGDNNDNNEKCYLEIFIAFTLKTRELASAVD